MKFEESKLLYERACETTPGGIHSNVRASWRPHPMFYERGRGSRVWDVDGNEFVDYVLGRGPLLLGHSPGPVLDAVKAQLDVGLMYAGQHRLEIKAAERFVNLVPCAETVRFSSSGSEAIHGAIRLARGVTGRNKILRFEGHYHGWFDNVFWNFAPPLDQAGPPEAPVAQPVTKGQATSDAENLVIVPWNDLSLLEAAFKKHGREIACVITEPILCNNGAIMPLPGYLEGMRKLCTSYGAVLIFDEVITGFRASLGGAQELFGVTPDLATFAKGLAGGFPVSAIAGKRRLMASFGDLSIAHSGTYNSNGPCMAAVVAALDVLSAEDGAALKRAHAMGTALMEGIREAGKRAGKDVHVRGIGPAFHVSFNDRQTVVDYRTFCSRDREVSDRFWEALQERGVRTVPEGLWFVSTVHTEADVEQTLVAVREAMEVI